VSQLSFIKTTIHDNRIGELKLEFQPAYIFRGLHSSLRMPIYHKETNSQNGLFPLANTLNTSMQNNCA